MNISESLRISFKEQFNIEIESYETGILLDSLVMTTEELERICRDKNNDIITRAEASSKSKNLREKAKRIMTDLTKLTKKVS